MSPWFFAVFENWHFTLATKTQRAKRDPRLDDIPKSVNDEIADRAIRHLFHLTALQNGADRAAIKLFDKMLPQLLDLLGARLMRIEVHGFDTGPATTKRLQQLAAGLDKILTEYAKLATQQTTASLIKLAQSEVGFETGLLENTIPIEIELNLPSVPLLRQLVTKQPFDGRVLGDWWKGLARGTRGKIMQHVRIGMVNGESSTQIAQRLRTNAVIPARRWAQSVAHTAVISVSANAREEVYKANEDLIKGVRWLATLDSRSCIACSSLDGKVFKVGEGPRPAIHTNCRCTTTPVVKSLKEMGLSDKDFPVGTRASMNGQVPADLTYNEWLRQQSAAIQDEALGVAKGKLFREGKLPIRAFTNRQNRVLTLDELEKREADVFKRVFG